MVGQGWRMLMECLAAGRAISLPSSAAAGAKAMLRVLDRLWPHPQAVRPARRRMEGLEEPLVRMVEAAYVNEAGRAVTAAMVSRGEKPSVISAIMKYQSTERMRRTVNDAMDLHGGRAICDGPSNYLQSAYQMVPVGITVEGANILTRTLITFAQGALRSHPYLYKEMQACQDPDSERGLAAFERAFLGHVTLLALEHLRRASSTTSRRGIFGDVRRTGADGNGALVPPALARQPQLRLRRRPDGGAARRRPEDQAEDHRPHGRRAVRALPCWRAC